MADDQYITTTITNMKSNGRKVKQKLSTKIINGQTMHWFSMNNNILLSSLLASVMLLLLLIMFINNNRIYFTTIHNFISFICPPGNIIHNIHSALINAQAHLNSHCYNSFINAFCLFFNVLHRTPILLLLFILPLWWLMCIILCYFNQIKFLSNMKQSMVVLSSKSAWHQPASTTRRIILLPLILVTLITISTASLAIATASSNQFGMCFKVFAFFPQCRLEEKSFPAWSDLTGWYIGVFFWRQYKTAKSEKI